MSSQDRSSSLNPRIKTLFAVALFCGATAPQAIAGTFQTISLAGVANDQLAFVFAPDTTYPMGEPTLLGGVPFDIPSSGDNIYNANYAASQGPGTVSLNVPIHLSGVIGVHTLINTGWGQIGPQSLLTVAFTFSDSTVLEKALIGNQDIRDHFGGDWTNSINGTSTINVYSTIQDGHAGFGEYRIDKQFFDLSAFENKTLTSISLVDSGDYQVQRAYLFGMTVEVVPEPSSVMLAACGALALLVRHLRRNG